MSLQRAMALANASLEPMNSTIRPLARPVAAPKQRAGTKPHLKPGDRAGLWEVLGEARKDYPLHKGRFYQPCRCACGVEDIVCTSSLTHGKTNGCMKCARKSRAPARRTYTIGGSR